MNRIVFIVFLFCNQLSFAQNYFERLMHIGANNVLYEGDYLHSVFVLHDNSFIAAGNDKGTNNNKGAFVLKLSNKGDSLWTKYYGFDGAKMIKLLNGNYLIVGIDTNFNYTSSIRLLQIDSMGNVLSSTKPTYKTEAFIEYFNTISQAADSSFIFSTYKNTSNGFVSSINKLNKDFSLAWQLNDTSFDKAYIRKSWVDESHNTWIIVSKKLTLYKYQSSIIKINTNGNIILSKSIISGRSYNMYDFIFDQNKQLICMGVGTDTIMSGAIDKAFVMKLDTNLNILWTKYYTPYTPWYGDNLISITNTLDGNYVLCGSITHNVNSGTNILGSEAAALIKIDTSGKMLWANIFDNGQTFFDNNHGWFDGTKQSAKALVQNTNGDFLLVGGKEFLVDKNNSNRGFRSYIILANDSGSIGKNKPVSAIIKLDYLHELLLYPNPANNVLHIENNGFKITKIEIYNSTGSTVFANDVESSDIDISHLQSGLYYFRCYTFENVFTQKLIIKK